ncbi:MAG: DUF1353 domain-containing protein [Kiritimatiellae bacterium]|nr:DUF1353 domain-containing protein [Kiritimatiellia bacterium]
MMYWMRHILSLMVIVCFAQQLGGVNAGMGTSGGFGFGGYGMKFGFDIGTDTSSGLIKYDFVIEFGQATGSGVDFSADLVKWGTGDFVPDAGGGFKWSGSVPLGKDASFSGTIKSDGTWEGTFDVKAPNGVAVSFTIDKDGNITAGAGAKISKGTFDIQGGAYTYHISGVLFDPYAPADSLSDAVLKGFFDVIAAPGYAVAWAQQTFEKMSSQWRNSNPLSGFSDPLEHPFVQTYKRQHPEITSPKIAFINIDDYCDTRDLLGIKDDEKGPFAILTEDYTFYDLDGSEVTIPKGFIFDGASFPDGGFLKFLIHGVIGMPGGRYDYRTLASGLIHDYMYRNPENNPLYTKDYADLMFMINSDIAGHPNPRSLWTAVQEGGEDAYRLHQKNREKGLYAEKFTSEYYSHNLEIYEKYQKRWTTGQLHDREGVSIDNDDCAECKIGGKDPNIVDNRKDGSGSGSGGNGGAGSGSGGGGGSGDGSGNGNGFGAGDGGGTGDPGSGGGTPGENVDPGYGLPVVTMPLPDVILPNGDGTKPWDSIVGFAMPYDRVLFLLSGDIPAGEDFNGAWNGLVDMTKKGVNLTEFKKMLETLKKSAGGIKDKLEADKNVIGK